MTRGLVNGIQAGAMQLHTSLPSPFSIVPASSAGLAGRLAALAAPALDPLLGLSTLDRLYEGLPPGNFIARALDRLGVVVDVTPSDLAHVPASGPVIVVANHPTGGVDGLVLAQALMQRRPDVRILGNRLLTRIPEMREWTIAVDPFDRRSPQNRRGLRAARAWLASGGLLVVFPAGSVSSVNRGNGALVDEPWHQGVVRLAAWSRASVVPAFINVRTSAWFRVACRLHPWIRTALLARELLRLRNRRVGLRVGAHVEPQHFEAVAAAAKLAYLRARTYALETAPAGGARRANQPNPIATAPQVDAALLERDISALHPDRQLLSAGPYVVYEAAADELPAVLLEIGRLRELAFRAVGEGTGRAVDLDRFDATYRHLFVWHRERHEVVGAYRIGATDRVCAERGVSGLYTHTLFRLSRRFLATVGPALELGRSFVRTEYQREPGPLLLLWKGIGALVAREPRYRRLFGPVSISASYSAISRGLLHTHLASLTDRHSPQVRPRHACPTNRDAEALMSATNVVTMDALDRLVRDMEGSRGVPVLVRQYARLNARVLGFSVDPQFGRCLDSLMLVDLADVPPLALNRYLGPAGAAAFRAHHQLAAPRLQAAVTPTTLASSNQRVGNEP